MINIPDGFKIVNLEKTGCSREHIQQCLNDHNLRERINWRYLGKIVGRGSVVLHTKNGDFTLKFKTRYGWVKEAEIL